MYLTGFTDNDNNFSLHGSHGHLMSLTNRSGNTLYTQWKCVDKTGDDDWWDENDWDPSYIQGITYVNSYNMITSATQRGGWDNRNSYVGSYHAWNISLNHVNPGFPRVKIYNLHLLDLWEN